MKLRKYMNNKLTEVEINGDIFYFSYETLVAVETKDYDRYVCENIWGSTTGRHLNYIDGGAKNKRLSRQDFLNKMEELGFN